MSKNGPTEQAAYERELNRKDREFALKKEELVQKEHNDKMLIRVTLLGAFVALVVGFAGFWAADEAHITRINDERPFLAVDVDNETAKVAEFGSLEHPFYINVNSTGKSPALRIHGSCETIRKPIKDHTKFKSLGQEFESSYSLPSRSTMLLCPALEEGTESKQVNEPVTVFGYVKYTDDLKEDDRFSTPFCYNVGMQRNRFTNTTCTVENIDLPGLK
jgi:hypothetical protein